MGLIKDLKEIKKNTVEIKAALAGDLSRKSQKLDEVLEDLSHVQLKVKSITDTVDYNGRPALKVVYEAPQILLLFDDDGNVLVNETFRAINGLDLIDMNDKIKLMEKINEKKI